MSDMTPDLTLIKLDVSVRLYPTILNPSGPWPQIISLLNYLKFETKPGEWIFGGMDNMGECFPQVSCWLVLCIYQG